MTQHIRFRHLGASAVVDMVDEDLGILNTLYSCHRQHGEATKVMEKIIAWADARGVVLILTAQGFGQGDILDNENLVRFYGKFGFVREAPDGVWWPARMRRLVNSRTLQGP